jgi:hypothetical protein
MTITIGAADLAALNAGQPVTLQGATVPKPNPLTISGFSPNTGGIGTQFVINGTGFTGATGVKIGGLTFPPTKIVSDSQLVATVPAGAVTGNIAVLNATTTAFDNSLFAVTAVAAPPPVTTPPVTTPPVIPGSGLTPSTSVPARTITPLTPPAGMKSITVKGKDFVDGNGNVVVLNGVNLTGLENTAIQGWDGSNYWGDSGFPGLPPVALLKLWNVNFVRVPYNSSSVLGTVCVDGTGKKIIPADPAGIYFSIMDQMMMTYTAAGLYIELEEHWNAPFLKTIPGYPNGAFLAPEGQGQFSDAQTSAPAAAQLAQRYKNFKNLLMGCFNEPDLDGFGPTVPADVGVCQRDGGTCARFINNTDAGADYTITETWEVCGFQTKINAIRNAGFTGPISVSDRNWAQDLSAWLKYKPTDPLNNIFADWHFYPDNGQPFNSAAYALGNFGAPGSQSATSGVTGTCYEWAQNILAAGYPVFITEYGGQNSAGSPPDNFVAGALAFAKANGISTAAWAFCVTGSANNNLLKNTNGDPCDGFPLQVKAYLTSLPPVAYSS